MSDPVPVSTIRIGDAEIDSALIAALREPRERMALLRLEQVFVEFVQSETDDWMEAGGPYNSKIAWSTNRPVAATSYPPTMRQTTFQRCVLHRLADRFGIIREPGAVLDAVGAIRLIKRPDSKIPSPLLQDLEASAYTEEAPKPAAARKMKIMKRDNRNHKVQHLKKENTNTDNANARRSLSDKEKAYAEARARIFQEENGDRDTASDSVTQGMANLNTSDEKQKLYHQSSSLRSSNGSLNSMNSSKNGTVETERKAVYRNYAEEANDPDFRRGVAVPSGYGATPVYVQSPAQAVAQTVPAAWPQLPSATPTPRHPAPSSTSSGGSLAASAPAFVPGSSKSAWGPSR